MRTAPPNPHFSQRHRLSPSSGAIEWEELPSLAETLARRIALAGARPGDTPANPARWFGATPVWDATRPAELEPTPPSQPFREPLRGLAMREVTEPDVFRHFFGASLAAGAARL